jgi:hypothetical protein
MNHPQHTTAPKPKCTPCLVTLAVGVVLLVVLSGRVATVIEKVFSGAGLEHCCTIEGVPFNYLGLFVLLCGIAAALIFALGLHVRDWLLRRDFERKYGVKLPAQTSEPARSGGPDYGPSMHGYQHHDDD